MASLAKDKILGAKLEDIGKKFLEELFASYHDKEKNEFVQAPFQPTELVTLDKNEYPFVKEKITTSVGQIFFNRYVLEKTGIIQKLGYWNIPIDKDGLEDLTAEVNNLAMFDEITMEQLGAYIDSRDYLGFWCAAFLSVSITKSLIMPMDNVNKRKDELFKQYEEDIKSDNPVKQTMAANKIEKELMGLVRENLKSDSGYDLYRSGDGNLDNNYKTINVMRGSVFNNITKKYDVVKSSLMGGIVKEDIAPFANSVVAAAYPSAVGTAEAGYMSKILLALLQSEKIDANPKSDCGTKATIPFTVTKKNSKYVLFRNIIYNGKEFMTDLHNVKELIGHTVRMYSPLGCTMKDTCAKCAGQAYYKLGATNIGLLSTTMTDKLLNLKLKSKHDLSQNAGIIPDDYIFINKSEHYKIEDGYLINKTKCKFFIPRVLDEIAGFVKEATVVSCMAIFPVRFYDNNDNVILSTMMIAPVVLEFNLYNDIQEDEEYFIITYEPNSKICSLAIQKTHANVEFFINQIFFYSKSPQLPYKLIPELMFRCLEVNSVDLTAPAISYEILARRLCRKNGKPFAYIFGKDPNVDQLSYEKLPFRKAVQEAGVLQGVLFQDVNRSLGVGLSQTLDGKKPEPTPLEMVIKA